jgi:hypothetical protein
MQIEGTINKFLAPVQKNSSLLGAGVSALERLPNIQDIVSRILSGQLHMPNVRNWITEVVNAPQYQSAAMVAILGYVLKDAVDNSTVKKLAEIAQNVGIAYVATGAAIDLAYFSTHSDEGCRNDGFRKPAIAALESPSTGNRGYS